MQRVTTILAAVAMALAVARGAAAQAPPPVDRVEEDWEVVVGLPDLVSAGPQITTMISADGDNSKSFIAFNLNYRDLPFRVGGMQLLAWVGTYNQGIVDGRRTAALATPDERVTWTQRLTISGGQATLTILNGMSQTWGSFGSSGHFQIRYPTTVGDLVAYSPDVSAKSSGVSWQANRVSKMTLVRVRYYSGSSLYRTEDTSRSIALSSD